MNEEKPPLFDKSFEALYKIAMFQADTVIGAKELPARFDKLNEEYNELLIAFNYFNENHKNDGLGGENFVGFSKDLHHVYDELADVLFVLLHIAHKLGGKTPHQLLHTASSKMLARMNDANYKAKC